MGDKKTPQWGIDRAYNMSIDNVERTKLLLNCIHGIEKGLYSEDEGLSIAESLEVISKADTYRRSTQTGLKAYGLLASKFELTEVSKAFINGKISFSELMILQLYKKEYKYSDSSSDNIVRPFVVLLAILLKLYEKEPDMCWIDYYDYAMYLTEIETYDEVDSTVEKIISDKISLVNRELDYTVNDFDIWMSAFEGTGLIRCISSSETKLKQRRYSLKVSELEFARFVWETRNVVPSIGEYDKRHGKEEEQRNRRNLFGSMSNGLFLTMPKIDYTECLSLENVEVDISDYIYEIMVEGKSARQVEIDVLGTDKLKGFFASAVLETIGLEYNKVKGIFAPFKSHMHLLALNKNYDKATREIIQILLEREDSDMEKYTYNEERVNGGLNKIYYGIPGCGKSYKISAILDYKDGFQEEAKLMGITQPVPKDNIFRTTFYLDYSNSDFVGQLMPKTERGKVYYKPVFGPFTKALQRACETKDMVYLVIEEINRGNAAAIFGDIFQLLDRYKDDADGHKKGDSMYPITNDFIEDYLGIERGTIILPSNLTILATMNTSDQNVFPLDTAFKRRWDRERVEVKWDSVKTKDYYVPYTDVTWKEFAESINAMMSSEKANGVISEDKKIGPYFIDDTILVEGDERHVVSEENNARLLGFANNVIDYLYNDVTKFDHEVIFTEKNSYDKVYSNVIEITKTKDKSERIKKFYGLFSEKISANGVSDEEPTGGSDDEQDGGTSNN